MYSYSQLLLRNIIFALLFILGITAISVFLFIENINDKQILQTKLITTISKQITADNSDAKKLVQALTNIIPFVLLDVSTIDGDKLYYNHDKKAIIPLAKGLLPKPVTITLPEKALQINFQINYQKEFKFLAKLLSAISVIILFFAIIGSFFSKQRYQNVYADISKKIKKQLSLIANDKNIKEEDLVGLSGLKQDLTEIKQLVKTHQKNSQALEHKAFTDQLTGLNNRNKFVHFFENNVAKKGKVQFGVLLITRCSELQTINKERGFSEGDRYICKVAKIMQSVSLSFPGSQVFRMNSSDFASILPNMALEAGEKYANELTTKFNEYQHASDLDSVAYTGLVPFSWQSPLGELLALADTSISVAQTQNQNSWFYQKDLELSKNTKINYGNQNWRQEIEHVLENNNIMLLVQAIQPISRNSKVYGEILARFLNSNDEMLPTASFIAMAEKLDKIIEIDRLIIETAINEIKHKNLLDKSFGLNISARSISDEHFLIWLERRLLKENTVASRLVFEITEFGLQQNIKSSKRFIDMVHRTGARITVERFGVGLTSFKFFRELSPDFIKMDSTYTRDIDEDKNNQYFLRLMIDLAHRLGIHVLAESVETLEEKHTLEKLFIDGCQGYYISKPTSL
jgi:diguanylate cyclase (GGDEF)-like protein